MTLDESSKLSPEQLRVAVSERTGWKSVYKGRSNIYGQKPGNHRVFTVPNYPESRDACATFEMELMSKSTIGDHDSPYALYCMALVRICGPSKREDDATVVTVWQAFARAICALPTQRCRAFLAVTDSQNPVN